MTTRKFEGKTLNENEKIEFDKIVTQGNQAEKRILSYADTLITAWNERLENDGLQIGVPDPHPCSLRTKVTTDDEMNQDYLSISNCCQRHVCRLEGYCKSTKHKSCRFGYPFKVEPVSRIEFTENSNSVNATILSMRNDPFMNIHNRLVSHYWRANVDMQIILDHHAAVNYMVKYATKCEKAGNNFNQLFKDVMKNATDEDNPHSKIRSLMIKSIAGKRDLGQCEVTRLLLSEPLYHLKFNYVTLSTDLYSKEVNVDKNADGEDDATKKSTIDFYMARFKIPKLQNALDDVKNLIDFTRKFTIKKGELVLREKPEKTVVITFPKVNF